MAHGEACRQIETSVQRLVTGSEQQWKQRQCLNRQAGNSLCLGSRQGETQLHENRKVYNYIAWEHTQKDTHRKPLSTPDSTPVNAMSMAKLADLVDVPTRPHTPSRPSQMTESYRQGMEAKVAEREKKQQLDALAALAAAASPDPPPPADSILHNRYNAPRVSSSTPGKMDHATVAAYQVGAHAGTPVTLLPQSMSANTSTRGMRAHARSSMNSPAVSGAHACVPAGRPSMLSSIDGTGGGLAAALGVVAEFEGLEGVVGGKAVSATAGQQAPAYRLPSRSSTARSVVVPQSFT